jgi:hypothetical protein
MHFTTIGCQIGKERLADPNGSKSDNGVVPDNIGSKRLCSVITGRLEHQSVRIAIWNRG